MLAGPRTAHKSCWYIAGDGQLAALHLQITFSLLSSPLWSSNLGITVGVRSTPPPHSQKLSCYKARRSCDGVRTSGDSAVTASGPLGPQTPSAAQRLSLLSCKGLGLLFSRCVHYSSSTFSNTIHFTDNNKKILTPFRVTCPVVRFQEGCRRC